MASPLESYSMGNLDEMPTKDELASGASGKGLGASILMLHPMPWNPYRILTES